jgi:hypothetical protein
MTSLLPGRTKDPTTVGRAVVVNLLAQNCRPGLRVPLLIRNSVRGVRERSR